MADERAFNFSYKCRVLAKTAGIRVSPMSRSFLRQVVSGKPVRVLAGERTIWCRPFLTPPTHRRHYSAQFVFEHFRHRRRQNLDWRFSLRRSQYIRVGI